MMLERPWGVGTQAHPADRARKLTSRVGALGALEPGKSLLYSNRVSVRVYVTYEIHQIIVSCRFYMSSLCVDTFRVSYVRWSHHVIVAVCTSVQPNIHQRSDDRQLSVQYCSIVSW